MWIHTTENKLVCSKGAFVLTTIRKASLLVTGVNRISFQLSVAAALLDRL